MLYFLGDALLRRSHGWLGNCCVGNRFLSDFLFALQFSILLDEVDLFNRLVAISLFTLYPFGLFLVRLMVHIQISKYSISLPNVFHKNQLFVRTLAYKNTQMRRGSKRLEILLFSLLETVNVVYRLIMSNQYQLMSHMTVHQPKVDRFVLGTTSKYITSYIEQRKALILAKLARNNNQPDKLSDQSLEYPKYMHIECHERGGLKQQGKGYMARRKSEVLEVQRQNKINKNGHSHRNNDTDQFLSRNSMYQKQKHLNLQLQKRKNLCTQASSHKFHPELPKKDDTLQPKQTERKKQKPQESYQLKHDKKYIRKQESERISYKDLMRQSMTKFSETNQNSANLNDQKERWKKIEEIFERVKPNLSHIDHPPHAEQSQNTKSVEQKEAVPDFLHDLQVNQLKLTLKKVESEEENLKGFMQNIQMQQHFEQDLSGILMDDDHKQEVDSSHVFQNVVKEMMLESEVIVTDTVQQKQHEEIEIAQCVSILDSQEEDKSQLITVKKSQHEVVDVRQEEWIKRQQEQLIEDERIDIKKVESQIIEPSELHSQGKAQELLQSKVEQYIEHSPNNLQEEPHSMNESLIDKLSDQIMNEEAQNEQVVRQDSVKSNERQKQSLQTLANQFMLLAPNPKRSEQDDDLSIPDEESPSIGLETFDFNTVSHEFTANLIINISPLQSGPSNEEPNQPQENGSNQQYQQNEETIEQIQAQQQNYHEEPRINNAISTLRSFGEFLVIPEQSEEQSHQSIG